MSHMRRSMDWEPKYGLDHPTWMRPEAFFYRTAEDARASMESTYGPHSGHIVVRMERLSDAAEKEGPLYADRPLPFGRCASSDDHEAHVFTRYFTVATDPIPDLMQSQTLWCPGGVA